jgi:hypothetical protein
MRLIQEGMSLVSRRFYVGQVQVAIAPVQTQYELLRLYRHKKFIMDIYERRFERRRYEMREVQQRHKTRPTRTVPRNERSDDVTSSLE